MKKQLDFLKLFSLVLIFLFASCQKNELEVEGHNSPKEEYTSSFVPKNRVVNEEQATSFVNKAMNALMKSIQSFF